MTGVYKMDACLQIGNYLHLVIEVHNSLLEQCSCTSLDFIVRVLSWTLFWLSDKEKRWLLLMKEGIWTRE